ncbi:MAG: hypothetical protein K6B28_02120 [Lachnospiraceae bacterium]|nr:hypothetical protein [Lachnospiraceae bacterium]
MNTEIIKIKNSTYEKYQEVLMRRDEVKKEAFIYERKYTRVFGDLILEVFQMKLESIRRKKTIEFCQIYVNRGESIDQNELRRYLAGELAEYYKKFEQMVNDNESAKRSGKITELELLKIKRIYHRLVKKIHPDINPKAVDNRELSDLWQRLIVAYNCNNLKEMEEIEVLVNMFLEKNDIGEIDVDIPDINIKIEEIEAEIETIISTDPYQYKYLLDDEDYIEQKKRDLRNEIKEYEDYCNQLDEMIEELMHNGMTVKWMVINQTEDKI